MRALLVISGLLDVIGELDLPLCSLLTYPLFGLGSWVLVLFVPEKKSSSKPMQFCQFIFIFSKQILNSNVQKKAQNNFKTCI